MPQCIKCGREISSYGLCANCSNASSNRLNSKALVCPKCGSRYCRKNKDGVGYYCSMCKTKFN
ncbi:MAG: hypothetical protein RR248_02225 [Clostridia bacterium]